MRRTLLLIASMALAVVIVSGVAFAAKPITKTKTFSSDEPITMTGGVASPDHTTITPPAGSFSEGSSIKDVNVTIKGLSVSDPSKLQLNLYNPTCCPSGLMYHSGGTALVKNVTFTLDDQALTPIPDPLTRGTWQPYDPNALSSFNGSVVSPYGPWELYLYTGDPSVADSGVSGKINGWSIQITTG